MIYAYSRRLNPIKVKFVTGFIYSSSVNYLKAKKILKKKFGKLDYESEDMPFSATDYYSKEMGDGLCKRIISFERLMALGSFPSIKRYSMKLESKCAIAGARTVNIDPGYLTEAKFVLTTTKDYAHRLYVGKGIFAEVTLQYRDDRFVALETTYPDFKTAKYLSILSDIRKIYRRQLNRKRNG